MQRSAAVPTVFLAVALVSGSATAQIPDSTRAATPPPRLSAALTDLGPGTRLRLHVSSVRIGGRLLHAGTDSLGLATDAGPIRVPLAAIDTVWRRKRATVAGLIIGALAGAGSYVFWTAAISEGEQREVDNLIGGLSAGGFLLAGVTIGTLVVRWPRIYP